MALLALIYINQYICPENRTMAKQVFFHVGLGKTGSIYLQYRVFPKLQGIKYIQRDKYRDFKYVKLIENSSDQKFLVSTGFDRQLEKEANNIASKYPQARIIVVLRRHDAWIASQYRRHVKNGYPKTFEEFIDVENDEGDWEQKDLYFYPKLIMLEQVFGRRSLVLFHDELVNNPHKFIEKICAFIGADYDIESINLKRKHTSYSEKQLKVRRQLSAKKSRSQSAFSKKYWVRRIQVFIQMPERYLSLYLAYLIPSKWIPEGPLISKESMRKVRAYYEEDWKKCEAYAMNYF
jgi:hypothetical protein